MNQQLSIVVFLLCTFNLNAQIEIEWDAFLNKFPDKEFNFLNELTELPTAEENRFISEEEMLYYLGSVNNEGVVRSIFINNVETANIKGIGGFNKKRNYPLGKIDINNSILLVFSTIEMLVDGDYGYNIRCVTIKPNNYEIVSQRTIAIYKFENNVYKEDYKYPPKECRLSSEFIISVNNISKEQQSFQTCEIPLFNDMLFREYQAVEINKDGVFKVYWFRREFDDEILKDYPDDFSSDDSYRSNGIVYQVNQAYKYVVDDSDGYTNLRKGKSVNSEVLSKVSSGEELIIFDMRENWWQVKIKEGILGYMHKSRIMEVK